MFIDFEKQRELTTVTLKYIHLYAILIVKKNGGSQVHGLTSSITMGASIMQPRLAEWSELTEHPRLRRRPR